MNKKQIIGLIVAASVFTLVCISSVLTNSYSKSINKDEKNTLSSFETMLSDSSISLPIEDFVGVVNVEGTIQDSSGSSSIFSSEQSYNHKNTLDYIENMKNATNNKGILLYVNSPGGGVYESDELYLKLKEYKEETGRPVWTYMSTEACSGGYYISMASDKIYANRNTWTGSIGVIMSLTNYKELYDKIGIKETHITSGPNKAIGAGGIDMTDEQKQILQGLVDEAYEQFAGIVADGRHMDIETVKPIADGRIYSAKQALDLGLIDEIDSYENMVSDMENLVGDDITFYTPKGMPDIFSSLFSISKEFRSKSDAQVVTEYLEKKGTGGLMYYAKPE